MRRSARLWVRWSWRDLRSRWLLVGAIGLIIAMGTGTYAGLGSTATWREQTNDASFAALRLHDVRLSLTEGATVPAGRLRAIVRRIPHADDIRAVAERLVLPTQVDVSSSEREVLVPGQLVGTDNAAGVDVVYASAGRTLQPGDDGAAVGVLEHQFARHFDLPATGTLLLSGGATLRYVGVGASPQHFIITSDGGVFGQGNLATVYVPLSTAQQLRGRGADVNEVVFLVRPGTTEMVKQELEDAFSAEFPAVGTDIVAKADEPAYRLLYEDIDNDQQFWNIIAFLVLAGAAFASFNLTTRMVESQRREIGVGMALGVPRWRLAIRPFLVGAQVAGLGVAAGVGVGHLLDLWLRDVYVTALPMPEWRTPFVMSAFARAAAIGFLMPFVATAIPIVRAIRVEPIDAIRTSHLTARSGRLVTLASRLPLPGRSYHQMPIRNLTRTPRRTVLTALGIGAAIATLVGTIGLVDSFLNMLSSGERELTRGASDRLVVSLTDFHPTGSETVRRVTTSPALAAARPGVRVAGSLRSGGEEIDTVIDLIPFDGGIWTPSLSAGTVGAVRDGGIVLSSKAARDLGVQVGDSVTLRHPRRVGALFGRVDRTVTVAALHPGPMRPASYLDSGQAAEFGLAGVTNVMDVRPADGVDADTAIREVFGIPGVASVQAVAASIQQLRETLDQYFGVLYVVELIVLVLALLIAFNSASISVDERSRENATMLAFGLRPRAILGMTAVESVAAGLLGTLVGIAGGTAIVRWMVTGQLDETVPELVIEPFVSAGTLVTAFVLGVVAVGLAPLLTGRRVARTDIPSRLRIIE